MGIDRSELARRLHEEPHPDDPTRRKFGGPQPGSGRPKVKRASTLAAEKAKQHADEIVDAFVRGVNSPDERTAVMSAEKWLTLEQKETALQMDEEKHLEELDRDALINMLAEGFLKLQDAGVNVMGADMSKPVIDATPMLPVGDEDNPFMP